MCLEAQQNHENAHLAQNRTEVIVGRRNGPYGDCPSCCYTDFCNNNCTQNNSVDMSGTGATERTTSFDIKNTPIMSLASTKPSSTTTHFASTKSTHPVTNVYQKPTSTHIPGTSHVVQDCSQYGSGYHQTRNLCIKFHFDLMNFNHSATTCIAEGAKLVTIDTEIKMSEIWTELQKSSGYVPDLWIGGRDVSQTDTFYWLTGNKVYPYSNWGKIPQQPEDPKYHDQDCIILHKSDNYTWYDEPCYRHYGFICEHPNVSIHSRTQKTTSCGSDERFIQLEHNPGCVLYVPTPMDWNSASTYCRGLDSHLVHIESEQKQQDIYRFMQTHKETSERWTGLVSTTPKPRNTNDWQWNSGLPYTYMNWGTMRPQGLGNCVLMMKDGSWYDRDCSTPHRFICEKY
ncbi:hypothetical protein CHS0354_029482 [Potamilus streckersoni]|uniref:C-type lectin domain-containing protein n=1 Tax=Potamilus streckersoni TaxID=2493646 RepID=A0AAE0VQM0_9BIVA|nr:hypothetical protein CHS0354_029482 [Potamilus streckersoni]